MQNMSAKHSSNALIPTYVHPNMLWPLTTQQMGYLDLVGLFLDILVTHLEALAESFRNDLKQLNHDEIKLL